VQTACEKLTVVVMCMLAGGAGGGADGVREVNGGGDVHAGRRSWRQCRGRARS